MPDRQSVPQCPQCFKPLRLTENVYEYDKGPPYNKRIVGTKPAHNRYAPFCTLRCGWRWAKQRIGRKKK